MVDCLERQSVCLQQSAVAMVGWQQAAAIAPVPHSNHMCVDADFCSNALTACMVELGSTADSAVVVALFVGIKYICTYGWWLGLTIASLRMS